MSLLLLIGPSDGPNFAGALCAETDPDLFYPEKGGSTRQAKQLCNACEHVTACLTWALEHDERMGVWGGLSERDRRKIRKEAS
jgi:WhiB family redox-sensing transcriptional regulator